MLFSLGKQRGEKNKWNLCGSKVLWTHWNLGFYFSCKLNNKVLGFLKCQNIWSHLWHEPWKHDDSCTKSWCFVQKVSMFLLKHRGCSKSFWNDTQHGFAKTSRVHNVIKEKGETTNAKKIHKLIYIFQFNFSKIVMLIITFVNELAWIWI